MSPYQNEQDGVSAGGKWMQFQSEDKMSGAKRVRFELMADNYFREDPDYKPRVELYLRSWQVQAGRFQSRSETATSQSPRFLGTAATRGEVRIDDFHTPSRMELGPPRPLPVDGQRHCAGTHGRADL
jgi:hypothetical protein